jgi:tetratricopeptide (TPR) repeat protein
MSAMEQRRTAARLWPLIFVATLLVYASVLRGGFLWDDDAYVWNNATLRSLHGLSRIWFEPGAVEQYYPLTYTVFWVEYHLWGLNTLGYHLVNVLLHALDAVLIGLTLTRLRLRGAWLAAFLFAVHPVHLESVAWITELKNVLSGFFYLTALLAYLDFEENRAPSRKILALALFTCALFSKSVACTLPVVLLLVAWARRGRVTRREALDAAPFFGIALLIGGLTLWVEKAIIGSSGLDLAFSPAARVLIAGRALWFYLGKLLWPSPLVFIYPLWSVEPLPWAQSAFPAAVLAALALLWRARARWGRWPLAAALFFAVTLAPALGFVSIYTMHFSFVADHFQYLASVGPIAAFAALLTLGLERLSGRPWVRGALLALLFVNLGLVDLSEARKYRNDAELWLDTLAKNPDCAMAHHNVGVLLARRGDLAQAAAELESASRLDATLVQNQLALAYVLTRLGRTDEALDRYRRAFALGASDPQIRGDYDALLKRSARP